MNFSDKGKGPRLEVIFGCMFSSKSSMIIKRIIILKEIGLKCLYINHILDNRSDTSFSTHNPVIKQELTSIIDTRSVNKLSNVHDLQKYDVIAVDEAQFFTDLRTEVMRWVETLEKVVIVGGLNLDHTGNRFGQINLLIDHADKITHLRPYCRKCLNSKNRVVRKAIYTQKIKADDTQIAIGGSELYQPICRQCYLSEKQ